LAQSSFEISSFLAAILNFEAICLEIPGENVLQASTQHFASTELKNCLVGE
jgi:hypothetical protein